MWFAVTVLPRRNGRRQMIAYRRPARFPAAVTCHIVRDQIIPGGRPVYPIDEAAVVAVSTIPAALAAILLFLCSLQTYRS